MIFASTPPINDDPQPYKYPSGYRNNVGGAYAGEWPRIMPRPAFDRPRAHEANSVLIAFRKYAALKDVAPEHALEYWLFGFSSFEVFGGFKDWVAPSHPFHALVVASNEQIDHARRVLTRLANFA